MAISAVSENEVTFVKVAHIHAQQSQLVAGPVVNDHIRTDLLHVVVPEVSQALDGGNGPKVDVFKVIIGGKIGDLVDAKAIPEHKLVRVFAAGQGVVASSALQHILANAPLQDVVASVAKQLVVTRAPNQPVSAIAAFDKVCAKQGHRPKCHCQSYRTVCPCHRR